jgi:hypothetical protein
MMVYCTELQCTPIVFPGDEEKGQHPFPNPKMSIICISPNIQGSRQEMHD